MYNYSCKNCNKTFQSMNTANKCIYCGSSDGLINMDGAGKSSSTPSNNGRMASGNTSSSSSTYITECNVCHNISQSSSMVNRCDRCNSTNVTAKISDTNKEYKYTCNKCSNSFSSRGTSNNCNRCSSTDIILQNDTANKPMLSYSCSKCNYTFKSSETASSCRRCSSTEIYTNNSRNASYDSGLETDSANTGNTDGTTVGGNSSTTEDEENKGFLENIVDGVGDIISGVGDFLGGAFRSVGDFFSSFYTSEDDEKSFIQSYFDSSDASLNHSIYGGAFGTFDDGSNIEDQDLIKNLQSMEDTAGNITEDVHMSANVFGMPLYYNAYADPCKNTFNSTIQYDLPLITFIPGKPKVNRKLIDATGSKVVDLDEYYSKVDGDTENPDFHIGVLNPKNNSDMRYLSFVPNYTEYWKYAQFLTSTVHAWLIAQDPDTWEIEKYNFSAELKNKYTDKYGLCFYADRSTTISENANNSYSTSRVAEMVNEKSSTTREASMVGKYGSFSKLATDISENIKGAMEGTMSGIESLKSFEGILTKTANSFMKVVNGAQLDFPEMWQDSKFDRSYSVSFRFYSPYGDRASIEKFVYTPFLALLALTLSRQDQAFSYIEPFLVRVDAPGWFSVDCGVITSMSINKGGSDNLWTVDGLPRLIEVTLEIQDLYPMIKQLSKLSMSKYNKGLCSYLENMAGIRAEDLTMGALANFAVNKWISNSILTTIPQKFGNWWDQAGYKADSFLTNLFTDTGIPLP